MLLAKEICVPWDIHVISVCFFVLFACVFDGKTKKIPNVLILCGIVVRCFLWGTEYFLGKRTVFADFTEKSNLFSIVVFLIFLALSYKVNALGAGDIKLFLLIGLYLPIKQSLQILFLSFFVAAAEGLLWNGSRIFVGKKKWNGKIRFSIPIFVALIWVMCRRNM